MKTDLHLWDSNTAVGRNGCSPVLIASQILIGRRYILTLELHLNIKLELENNEVKGMKDFKAGQALPPSNSSWHDQPKP